MIPKRMIFIWLGKNPVPEYGKHAMKVFREVNPDFELMFVHEPDIENTKNEDLKECLRMIDTPDDNMYRYMIIRKYAIDHFHGDVGKYVGLSDAFRLYLLNKYGGIYLDLDTFPVNPFDGDLLEKRAFAVNYVREKCDYFFIGFEPGCIDRKWMKPQPRRVGQIYDYNIVQKIKYKDNIVFSSPRFEMNKRKLIDGTLEYGETVLKNGYFPDYYIDHYRIGSWISIKN